jgi:NAD(P)-dependent dehydrogenase (short-subunit alcohol dehydrogenase family)
MLNHRVVIVTGGHRASASRLGVNWPTSAPVYYLADQNEPGVIRAAKALQADGGEALGLRVGVTQRDDIHIMIQQALDRWGHIDILVNNAGVCPITAVDEITDEEWDFVLSVNLKGTFLCSQAVIPVMRKQGGGRIINISSVAGQAGGFAVGVHYSGSKAGILGLTKSLARVLAPQIQVNAIAAGTTDTEMTRGWDQNAIAALVKQITMKRLGRPVDVAAMVVFLASDQASFITGQTFSVNGGLLMP